MTNLSEKPMRSMLPILMAGIVSVGLAAANTSACTNSGANNNAQMVQAWSEVVSKTAEAASEVVEEMPMTEAALAVVEVGADITEAVAESFEGNAMGSPTPVAIPWDDIKAEGQFWTGHDGDTIYMTKTKGTGQLIFQQTNLTWWKGIVAFDKQDSNKWKEIACLQDDNNSMTLTVNPGIAETQWISLSKAKTLGVHTNMYLITNWADASTAYDYVFNWVKD